MNYGDYGIKIIDMKALTYKTTDGQIKRITAKKYPKLFKNLTAIIKEAEKNGTLWGDQVATGGD